MKKNYKMVKEYGEASFIERKSRFISYTMPVYTEEEALQFISDIKKKHYDARHNCYAYIIGENSAIQRSSDDGEPSGTAGMPILEVIKKEDLTNTLVVVTRYFGGILLGAGGLIRAYAEGAVRVIAASGIQEVKPFLLFNIKTDYSYLGKIQHEAEKRDYIIKETKYTEYVNILMLIPEEEKEEFQSFVSEWTNGSASVKYIGDEMLKVNL